MKQNVLKPWIALIGVVLIVFGVALGFYYLNASQTTVIIQRDIFVDIPENLCDVEGNPSILIQQLYDEDDIVPVEIDYYLTDKTIRHDTTLWYPDGTLQVKTSVISGTHSQNCP